MFTHTVDKALDRWTDEAGNEYAYVYDDMAESPFLWGWEGLYLSPRDPRMCDAGDEQIYEDVEAWGEQQHQLEEELEDADDDEHTAILLEELDQHRAECPDVRVFMYAGYQVFVERETFCNCFEVSEKDLDEFAKGLVDTYHQWANGEVYLAGVTTPEGDTEYCGGIYLDWARPDREQIEEIMRDFV